MQPSLTLKSLPLIVNIMYSLKVIVGLVFRSQKQQFLSMLCVALIMLAWTRVFGLKGCALWVQHPLVGRRGTSALCLYCEARTDQSLVTVPWTPPGSWGYMVEPGTYAVWLWPCQSGGDCPYSFGTWFVRISLQPELKTVSPGTMWVWFYQIL